MYPQKQTNTISQIPRNRRAILIALIPLALIAITLLFLLWWRLNGGSSVVTSNAVQTVDLAELESLEQAVLDISDNQQLIVNGELVANGAFILNSSVEPQNARPGEVYFDAETGSIRYYDGSDFTDVATGENICYVGADDNCGYATVEDFQNVRFVGGSGISLDGTNIVNIGDVDPTDDLTTLTTFSGDVSGTYDAIELSDDAVASANIVDGSVTVADLTDSSINVLAGNGLSGGGAVTLGGSVSLALPTCALNEILEFDGSNWICDVDDTGFSSIQFIDGVGGTTTINTSDTVTFQTGGAGLTVSVAPTDVLTFTNTGDTDASDDITTASTAGGDLSGVFSNLQIAGNAVTSTEINDGSILFADLAQNSCSDGQIIKWNNTATAWECAADNSALTNLSLTGDTGTTENVSDGDTIRINGGTNVNTVATTADTITVNVDNNPTFTGLVTANGGLTVEAGDQLTINGDVLTDLTGTGLQLSGSSLETVLGVDISGAEIVNGTIEAIDFESTNVAGVGEDNFILTYDNTTNGFTWVDPTTVGAAGSFDISDGSATETIDDGDTITYAVGAGLTVVVSGTDTVTYTNTGDTNAADDIITSTNAGGDLSGTFSTLAIAANAVESAEISDGTVQAIDLETTNVAAPGLDNYILTYDDATGGFTYVDPAAVGVDTDTTYTAGNGLTLTGTVFSVNSPTCSGTDKLQWNGSAFVCTADVDTTYTAGTGISILANAISATLGTTIDTSEITDDTILAADFDSTTAPTGSEDGWLLTYDDTTGGFTWVNPTGVGSASDIDITDGVTTQNLTDGETLTLTAGTNATISLGGTNEFTIGVLNNPTFSGLVTLDGGATFGAGDALTIGGNSLTDLVGTGLQNNGGSLEALLGATIDNSSEIVDGVIANVDLANDDVTVNTGNGLTGGATLNLGDTTTLNLDATTTGTTATTSNNSGLEVTASGLRLIGGCSVNNILKWDGTDWACDTDTDGTTTGVTALNSLTGGLTIAGTANQITVADNGSDTVTLSLPDAVTLGADGSAGTLSLFDGGVGGAANTATIDVASSLGQDTVYTLQDPGVATANICLSTGNCVGGAGGGAPNSGEYITYSANATLSAERVLSDGTNTVVDFGTAAQAQVDIVDNPTFAGLLTLNGGVTLETGDTITINGDAITDLTGTGLLVSSNTLQTTLGTTISTGEITNGTILAEDFDNTAAPGSSEDNYILSYDDATGGFTWVDPAGAGTPGSFDITDGGTTETVDDGDTVNFAAGAGLSVVVSGTDTVTYTNTGDTNAADDITTASTAGGDLSGTFSTLAIAADAVTNAEILNGTITFADLGQNSCGMNEIIKWNGSAWACATDNAGAGTSLSLTGDSGTPETLGDGDTIDIAGGTNITTAVSATDTVTLNVINNPTFSGLITANGGLTVEAGDTFTFNSDAFTDLTGTGLTFNAGSLETTLGTAVDGSEITDGVIEAVDLESTNVATVSEDNYVLTYDNTTGGFTYVDPATVGVDTDTTYTAGNGLTLSSTEFSVNSPTCSGTDKIQWNGTAFICSTDVDTTYTASTGINIVAEAISTTLGVAIDTSEITDDTILAADLNNTTAPGAPEDNYLLSYDDATGGFTWVAAGAGTNFSVAGDSGPSQTISDANTLSILGGTNIDSVASATDNITLNLVNNPTFSGLVTANGGLTVEAGDTFTFNGDAFTDLAGTGLQFNSGSLESTLGVDIQGSEIVNGTIEAVDVESTNVAGAGTDNYVLTYDDATGGFTYVDPSGLGLATDIDITDGVTTETLTDGNTLTFTDGTNIDVVVSATDTLTVSTIAAPTFSGLVTLDGGATFGAGDTLTIGGDTIDEFVGTGLQLSSGDLQTTLGTDIVTGEIADDTILAADFNNTAAPGAGEDNYLLTYDDATGGFTWVDPIGLGDSKFTDGGAFTYLTATGDTLLTGASTANGGQLESLSTTEQLRLSYDVSNFTSFLTDSFGYLTIDPSGGIVNIESSLFIGIEDTNNGTINLRGNGTGSDFGAIVTLDTAADFDALVGSYGLRAYQDDFEIRQNSTTVLQANSAQYIAVGNAGTIDAVDGNGDLFVEDELEVDGAVQFGSLDCTGNANGGALTADASGNVTCSDDDGGGASLFTDGGAFTYLTSVTDDLLVGGTSIAGADIIFDDDGSAVFNEQGNNADFRVEGDTEQNLLFVDASTDRVGIGTSSPGNLLDVSDTVTDGNNTLAVFNADTLTTSNSTSSTISIAAFSQPAVSSGVTDSGTATGISSGVAHLGAGTLTNARGITVSVDQISGTITNGYGLYIENVQATNAYGIYQSSASNANYFAGALEVDSSAQFDGNTTLGNSNTDTLTINSGTSGTGITLADSSFFSCTALETDASGVLTCGTDDGVAVTLQGAYDNDTNGSDTRIDLTANDDSLVFSNPASGGSDNDNVLTVEQLDTGIANGGLIVTSAGGNSGYAFRVNDDGTSSDSTPFVIGNTGNVAIGATSTTSVLEVARDATSAASANVAQISGNLTYTTGASESQTGLRVSPSISPGAAATGSYYGAFVSATSTNGNISGGTVVALNSFAGHSATGSLGTAVGGRFYVNNSGVGSISEAYGIQIVNALNPSGVIQDSAGLNILHQTSAGDNTNLLIGSGIPAGNDYSIYNSSGYDNVFNGNLRIGSTVDPTVELDVTGDGIFSGSLTVSSDTVLGDALLDSLTISSGNGAIDLTAGYFDTCTALETVGGILTCGTDATGSGLFTDDTGFTYLTDTVEDLVIGGTSVATGDIFLGDNGASIFNRQGNNVDFRVEGDTNENLLFVDANTDRVGIGTNAPGGLLEVANGANSDLSIHLDSGLSSTENTNLVFQDQDTDIWSITKTSGNRLRVVDNENGDIRIDFIQDGATIYTSAGATAGHSFENGNFEDTISFTASGNIISQGNTDDAFTTTFSFLDPTAVSKTITVPNATGTICLDTSTACGGIFTNDTGFSYVTDVAEDLIVGGTSLATADILLAADGSATFNEQLNDSDFIVKGNANSELLFVDASTNRVGIGISSPGSRLDVYDDALNGTNFLTNFGAQTDSTASGNHSTTAVFASPSNDVSSGITNTGSLTGLDSYVNKTGAGTLSSAYAAYLNVDAGAGTITNGYGLYVADIAGTNDFGIYQSGTNDDNYFAGELFVGGTSEANADIFLGNDGAAVFNEQANSVDLRIEGSTDANLLFVDASADSVGIGNNTPGQALDVTGTIRQSNATSCSLTTNGSGDINCTSDERLKNVYGQYAGGLDAVRSINPITFSYLNDTTGDVRTGFSAQNVKDLVPNSAPLQETGYYGFDATAILATTVNAIKDLDLVVEDTVDEVSQNQVASTSVDSGLQTQIDTLDDDLQDLVSQFNALDLSSINTLNSIDITTTSLEVTGTATIATLNVTGDVAIDSNLLVVGETEVQDIVVNGKIISAGDTPQVAGVATTTAVISGNDTAGTVSVTIDVASTDVIASVIFDEAYDQAPRITLTPLTSDAAVADYYVTRTATGFDVVLSSNATAAQVLEFDYQVIQ